MRPTFALLACCVLMIAGGCANGPSSLSKDEVEAKLKSSLSLSAVSLSARSAGGFTGTGQTSDGTHYTITVEQKEADRRLWYSASSDTGELKAGAFQEFGPSWLRPLTQVRNGGRLLLILLVVIGGAIFVANKLFRRSNPDSH